MKIFLDTANPTAVEKWVANGVLEGVTTNPTHLSKQTRSPLEIIQTISSLMPHGDISVEVTELEPASMLKQARRIAAIAQNITVKIPCHVDYYSVIKTLVGENIGVNVTLVFSPLQALMMCTLGVKYISPFVGRWDDIGADGMHILEEIRHMVDTYNYPTKILAASLRSVAHFQQALVAGADIATVPEMVLQKAVEHPLTNRGIETFDTDWKALGVRVFP